MMMMGSKRKYAARRGAMDDDEGDNHVKGIKKSVVEEVQV